MGRASKLYSKVVKSGVKRIPVVKKGPTKSIKASLERLGKGK